MLIIHRQGVGIRSEMGELRSSCSVGTSGICQHVLYGCQCADIGFFVFYGVHKKQRVEEAHCVRLDAISFWHPASHKPGEASHVGEDGFPNLSMLILSDSPTDQCSFSAGTAKFFPNFFLPCPNANNAGRVAMARPNTTGSA